MQRSSRLRLDLVLVLAVTVSGAARAQLAPQVPPSQSQGQMSTWAFGLTTIATTGSVSTAAQSAQLLLRSLSVNSGLPTTWSVRKFGAPSQNHPNHSIEAITQGLGITLSPNDAPLFGGISTGGDVTPPVDTAGVLQQTLMPNWYGLTITVDRTAQGVTGSLIAQRKLAVGDPSGDVFSYYPAGSSMLDPILRDVVRVETRREELNLASNASISNLDYGMGLIAATPNDPPNWLTPNRTSFYFTLTGDWLQLHAAPQWVDPSTSSSRPVTPADICCSTWNGTAWSTPVIAYPWTELFPPSLYPNAAQYELDALSVYNVPAGLGLPAQDRVVFSLKVAATPLETPEFDQLLVYQRSVGGVPACPTTALQVTVPNASGAPQVHRVSTRIGLRQRVNGGLPDDVKGTCGEDPRHEAPVQLSLRTIGIGLGGTRPEGGKLGLSTMHTLLPDPSSDANGIVPVDAIDLQVSGLDLEGCWVGGVQLFTLPDDQGTLAEFGPTFLVWPGQTEVPLSLHFPVPPTSNRPTRLLGQYWGLSATSAVPVLLGESWVITFFL